MNRLSPFRKITTAILFLSIFASGAYFFWYSPTKEPVLISESNLSKPGAPPIADTDSQTVSEPLRSQLVRETGENQSETSPPSADRDLTSSRPSTAQTEKQVDLGGSPSKSPARQQREQEFPLTKDADSGPLLKASSPETDSAAIEDKSSATPHLNYSVSNEPPKGNPEFWLWLGGGMNFQYYKQSIPGVSGEAVFQNVQEPTVLVQAGFQGKTLGLDLSYKETPGKMASSDTITVTNGNYSWRTLSAEGLYRKDDNWNFRTGFQHHSMPFMSLDATTAIIDVKSNTLTMLTLGFDRSFEFSNRLRGEWKMRYQHPLISGSVDGTPFSVTPKFAFDGSVGGVYSLSTNTRVGLYWYGQWHEYGFSYGHGVSEFSGSQTLFYSNIEIRLGLEF